MVGQLRVPSYLACGLDRARPHVPASIPRESGDGVDAGQTAFHSASLGDNVGKWSDTAFYMLSMQCGQVRKCLDGGYWSQPGGGSAGPVYPQSMGHV